MLLQCTRVPMILYSIQQWAPTLDSTLNHISALEKQTPQGAGVHIEQCQVHFFI